MATPMDTYTGSTGTHSRKASLGTRSLLSRRDDRGPLRHSLQSISDAIVVERLSDIVCVCGCIAVTMKHSVSSADLLYISS
jgi:hypothetical protein